MMQEMKKRTKNLQITIDSLPFGIEGGNMITGSSSSITSLIGVSLGFRRRKNFSLILLVGLSALLCALYYTSYYPGVVWTLRLGVTSFGSSQALESTASRAGTNVDKRAEKFSSSASDGTNDDGTNNPVISSISSISAVGSSSNNHNNAALDGEGERGEILEEISTPKTWNWKYWASLEYWKVNLTGATEDDNDGFSGRLSEKPAGGGSAHIVPSDFSTTKNDDFSHAAVLDSSAFKAVVKVGEFQSKNGRRLACNFPRLNPFDPSITDFIKSPPTIDCSKNYQLVFRTNFRNKLIQWGQPFSSTTRVPGENGSGNYTCCYKTITRGNGSDHNIIFSKRCFPILQEESEIPVAHEFISVRCRNLDTTLKNYRRPSEKHSISSKSNNGSAGTIGGSDADNNENNNGNSNNSSSNTKVYKDMMAFVPLKPLVEDRIRKYEESKRKSRYVHKKTVEGSKTSNKDNGDVEEKTSKGIHLLDVDIPQTKHFSRTSNNSPKPEEKVDDYTSEAEANADRLSVLILGLDAQSHMNFIRQMPRTYNFLTKNLSSIGMYGYTKVGDNTFPNVVTLLSGLNVEELEKVCWPTKQSFFDSCPFIWKKFADSGYRTSLAEDSVWMGTFNYEKKGFLHPPTDYYLHPMSLLMAKKIGHETWANAKLCYGPRLAFEVLLDYIVKTAVTFRYSLYFQFVWANSLFHDYLNNPRLGDELLYMTLEFLSNNSFFNNTAFILLSDHGIRWGSIRSTYQGKIEERMPLAYFTFPLWFRRKYPQAMRNLRKNVLRLTTPFDVHETLKDILSISQGKHVRFDSWDVEKSSRYEGESTIGSSGKRGGGSSKSDEKPPRGISLFRPIPLQRTCKMAGIEEHWCVCHSMKNFPINSTLVQSGAQFIVQVINGLVKRHSRFCAKLSLFKINEAKRKIDGDIDKGLEIDFYFTNNETTSFRSASRNSSPHGQSRSHDKSQNVGKRWSSTIQKYKTDNVGKERAEKNEDVAGLLHPIVKVSTLSQGEDIMASLSTTSDIKKMIQLQITVVTRPGDAVFEATIYGEAESGNGPVNDQDIDQEAGERSSHHWKLSGDISRLNLYGSQSACVSDYTVQKYCYCHSLSID
ncbi:unnamed protein product [Orchesella dallaii]|uniref:Uncharacterized protein n=1 Tax=Orchesella dallaii TaxID=48710 RepID=A0ABP1QB11_9HEXA